MARKAKTVEVDEMEDGEEMAPEDGIAIVTAVIEVPVTVERPEHGECIRRVDLTLRSDGDSLYVLASMRKALNAQHARLKDGHHVESNADVVRWLLEQVKMRAA